VYFFPIGPRDVVARASERALVRVSADGVPPFGRGVGFWVRLPAIGQGIDERGEDVLDG
jgi:hypothetical protein